MLFPSEVNSTVKAAAGRTLQCCPAHPTLSKAPAGLYRHDKLEGLIHNPEAAAAGSTPVGVALIHDDKAQVGQDAGKVFVQGQDALMQHVGVGDQNAGPIPDLGPVHLHMQLQAHAQLQRRMLSGVSRLCADRLRSTETSILSELSAYQQVAEIYAEALRLLVM